MCSKESPPFEITILLLIKRVLLCHWELKLAYKTQGNTMDERIIDKFNVLRQQPEIIRNAVRPMVTNRQFFAWNEMGNMLKGMAYVFKFHVNN